MNSLHLSEPRQPRKSDQIAVFDAMEKTKCLGKKRHVFVSWLFVKHCEQAGHHPVMQQHLEEVEAIEVVTCVYGALCFVTASFIV